MAQVFYPSANTIARLSLLVLLLILGSLAWVGLMVVRSPYATNVGVVVSQPVPFSHQHHVAGLGIDCRYCHTSVEESAFAGIPSTQICYGCHSQVWANAPMLEPVRASMRNDEPLVWTRVHDLPDHAYFNHSIHVRQGVGCVTCHGNVGEMPLMWKAERMQMDWCLDCHRAPEKYVRPREHVFDLTWEPKEDQLTLGRRLVEEYGIDTSGLLMDCWTCHR